MTDYITVEQIEQITRQAERLRAEVMRESLRRLLRHLRVPHLRPVLHRS
jgi:hypothetical protein